MKAFRLLKIIFLLIALPGLVSAQTPVTISINTQSPVTAIPEDFSGLSFGTIVLKKGPQGYLFDSTNTQMLTLFRQLGIKHLRIGGTAVDTNRAGYVPEREDIDALFGFAKASKVKVIYSFRLMNGDTQYDASTAKYIWEHYRQYIDCFSVGNEPDLYKNSDPEIKGYSSYNAKWKRFALAIQNSVPEIKFGGPDLAGTEWYKDFVNDEASSGFLTSLFEHWYVGGGSKGKTAAELIDDMLSSAWVTSKYPARLNSIGALASKHGLMHRFTEANSFYGDGIKEGSTSFATSLFALDFLYWWALNGARGVDYHCTMSRLNTTIYTDSVGNLQVYPIAYGIKAFNIGGHGKVFPVTIKNENGLNLTAYASGSKDSLYLTIINKEHGTLARSAKVTIKSESDLPLNAEIMSLTSPGNDPAALSGMSLGGGTIKNSGIFQGTWSPLKKTADGSFSLNVPSSSAMIISFTR